jgi:hypothetical protein
VFREIAEKKGWRTSSAGPLITPVEKDILTFDSFAVLAELLDTPISFGGGTLLNWVYARDRPRFSFDIDSQAMQHGLTKKYFLENLVDPLNKKLRRMNKVLSVKYGGQNFEIGTVVYDKEKDHFSEVLSLKRRVYCITAGAEAQVYLKKESKLKKEDAGEEGRRIKEFFSGEIPKIEDIRIEIGIPQTKGELFPANKIEVSPLVYPEVNVEPVKANVTLKEDIVALKIFKLGEDYNHVELKNAIPDFVKSVCDISSCSKECNINLPRQYLEQICKFRAQDKTRILNVAMNRIKTTYNEQASH